VLFAAERGCHVVGVTPSRPQREYILRRAGELGVADRVEVELGRFTATDLGEARFDAVSMIGSIVHMPDRVAVLAAARRRLRAGGRLYLSESCFRNRRIFEEYRQSPGFQYVGEEIFGFGEMVPLAELIAGAESVAFSIVGVSDLTAHYPRTIEDWATRARENRERIEKAAPGTTDRLLHYFKIGAAAFGYTTKHYAFVAERSRMGTWEGI
jgi:cyclopropane-fatty-acyl-phospholipid synthase